MKEKNKDHRVTVGAMRRLKTHRKLISSGMSVIANKGIESSLIEDVIKHANVSRGTFYNYFDTGSSLITAIGEEISEELISRIEPKICEFNDPITRLATGLHIFIQMAYKHPILASFLSNAGFNSISPQNPMFTYLPKHIEEAIQNDQITIKDSLTAVEIVGGMIIAAMYAISNRNPSKNYAHEIVTSILLGLGANKSSISTLDAQKLPKIELPEDSVINYSSSN